MEQRHHAIISGTGRAGTTFLVQLLTALGLDTGYASPASDIFPNCRAGMERDIREPGAPYIVKSPFLCDYLDEVLQTGDVVVDHALVPVRDLYAAAESRRAVVRESDMPLEPSRVPGGLWHTDNPADQEAILVGQLYKLFYTLAKHDVPVTLLYFPRLARDVDYLYEKLRPVLGQVDKRQFTEAFNATSRPDLVHDFRQPVPPPIKRTA